MSLKPTADELKEWTRPIKDPEINVSLVDLGLIYEILIGDTGEVSVKMTLTTPTCPAAPAIVDMVKKRLEEHEFVTSAKVELVWEPKWDPKTMANEEGKDALGIW
ncbi:MAG TPA: metal-sulfur cluster assembly factor [Bdellovibrionota bacterium]|jgi:metal-sulfur cluster biosynthetic enzyme|nr:metal-sulfur cluster assembly factor [Bdellovibrionota bacterium]